MTDPWFPDTERARSDLAAAVQDEQRATQKDFHSAMLITALWLAAKKIGASDEHIRHWLNTSDLARPGRILAQEPADPADRVAVRDLHTLSEVDATSLAAATARVRAKLTATPP